MWSRQEISKLYQQHSFAIYRRCRRLLGNEAQAQDMMQQVFLRCMESERPFVSRAKEANYLFRVATNLCLNHIRDQAARDRGWLERAAEHLWQQRHQGPLEDRVAFKQLLTQVLAEADAQTQEIAIYHYVEGLSQGEVAKLTGLSRVTINQRLRRLREQALKGAL